MMIILFMSACGLGSVLDTISGDAPIRLATISGCDPDDPGADGSWVYQDFDRDGVGVNPEWMCTAPLGFVEQGTDCDDFDPARSEGYSVYPDRDQDGYGAATGVSLETDAMLLCAGEVFDGYVPNDDDCDDNDPAVHTCAA